MPLHSAQGDIVTTALILIGFAALIGLALWFRKSPKVASVVPRPTSDKPPRPPKERRL